MPDLAKSALWYATKRSWPVFPIHSPWGGTCDCSHGAQCASPAKHPRTATGLKEASRSADQIALWWEHHPNANIGIVTGRASGLFVLDVDPDKGGSDTLAELLAQHGPLPETPLSLTGGGGEHYLFRYPDQGTLSNSQAKLGPGLDTRGEGGYIVAPPSLHMSLRSYRWEASSLPTIRLAPVPPWITTLLGSTPTAAPAVDGPIPEGKRDATLASLAGTMRRRGMGEAAICAALLVENQRCSPPLSNESVLRIARSVVRYAPADSPRTSVIWTVQPA